MVRSNTITMTCRNKLKTSKVLLHKFIFLQNDMFHLVSLSKIPSNAFNDVPPTVSGPKNVARPVYLTKNARHKYAAFPTFREQLRK